MVVGTNRCNAAKLIALMLMVLVCCFFMCASAAHAESIKAVKVTQPTSIHLGKTKSFLGNLKYDNRYILEVGHFKLGANIPVEAELNIEVPTLVRKPEITSHTNKVQSRLLSKKKTVIGREAWSTFSRIWITSPQNIKIGMKALAVSKGTSETYIGTRPLTKENKFNTEYNSYKSFKVIKKK